MKELPRPTHLPQFIQPFAYSQRWIWVAIVQSIMICMAIAGLHFQQKLTLEQATEALDTLRHARIDLTEGFLYMTLAGKPASPFSYEQGHVLLDQAMTMFDQLATGSDETDEAIRTFHADIQAFRTQLDIWSPSKPVTVANDLQLRLTFTQLIHQIDRLDEATRNRLRDRSNQLDSIFAWALSGSALLLSAICWMVLLSTNAGALAERERKRSQEALREREEIYRIIVEQAGDSIGLIDAETGMFIEFNTAAHQNLGYSREEFATLTVADIDVKLVASALAQSFATSLREGHAVIDTLHRHKNGETRAVQVSTQKVHIRGKDYLASIWIDITERKRTEQQLRTIVEDLRRSNAELEQFAYVASHDLQEPLRAITGMVQLLQQRYEGQLDERANTYIQHAVEAVNRMQALINDLLSLSRVERKGRPFEPVEMAKVLRNVLDTLRLAIRESGVAITHDALPVVLADAPQIGQLMQNLIGNAIKFRRAEAPRIHIGVRETAERWYFSVCDNGIGIEAQYFERIFQIFQRLHTRREYPGTGIGLAICKKIVERHDGELTVESVAGQGSTFTYTLPKRR